jgi:hypothetical protein
MHFGIMPNAWAISIFAENVPKHPEPAKIPLLASFVMLASSSSVRTSSVIEAPITAQARSGATAKESQTRANTGLSNLVFFTRERYASAT